MKNLAWDTPLIKTGKSNFQLVVCLKENDLDRIGIKMQFLKILRSFVIVVRPFLTFDLGGLGLINGMRFSLPPRFLFLDFLLWLQKSWSLWYSGCFVFFRTPIFGYEFSRCLWTLPAFVLPERLLQCKRNPFRRNKQHANFCTDLKVSRPSWLEPRPYQIKRSV